MKVSNHFDIREFVPRSLYEAEGCRAIRHLDLRLINVIEAIRALCGNKPIRVNDWHYGGRFQYRGFRPADSTVGAARSMHKQGKALDFDVIGMTAEQVRGVIRLNQIELLKLGLTRIERGVSWVHIDLKHTGLDRLYEFNP